MAPPPKVKTMKWSLLKFSLIAIGLAIGAGGAVAATTSNLSSLDTAAVNDALSAEDPVDCELLCSQEEELCVQSCLSAEEDQREDCESHCAEVYSECLVGCQG